MDVAHDHRFMAQIVAPPVADRPIGEAAARALQLVSVASQGVNNLTKVVLDDDESLVSSIHSVQCARTLQLVSVGGQGVNNLT